MSFSVCYLICTQAALFQASDGTEPLLTHLSLVWGSPWACNFLMSYWRTLHLINIKVDVTSSNCMSPLIFFFKKKQLNKEINEQPVQINILCYKKKTICVLFMTSSVCWFIPDHYGQQIYFDGQINVRNPIFYKGYACGNEVRKQKSYANPKSCVNFLFSLLASWDDSCNTRPTSYEVWADRNRALNVIKADKLHLTHV